MPRRSNDFQKLIAFIETQLAPAGATVTESAMVETLDGKDLREIDVLIKGTLGHHEVCIALECRDRKRRADVTWIEQLEGKYRYLPIDRVIAVSRSGFTEGAKRRAQTANISTLALEEAVGLDWTEEFSRWAVGLIVWYHPLVSAHITYYSDDPPEIRGEVLMHCRITDEIDRLDSTFEQDVLELYQKHAASSVREWSSGIMPELWRSGEGKEWDVDVTFSSHGRFLVDANERKHEIKEVILTLRCRFEFQRAAPRHFTYGKARLAAGSLEPEGHIHRYEFDLLYDEDGTPQALRTKQVRKTEDCHEDFRDDA